MLYLDRYTLLLFRAALIPNGIDLHKVLEIFLRDWSIVNSVQFNVIYNTKSKLQLSQGVSYCKVKWICLM